MVGAYGGGRRQQLPGAVGNYPECRHCGLTNHDEKMKLFRGRRRGRVRPEEGELGHQVAQLRLPIWPQAHRIRLRRVHLLLSQLLRETCQRLQARHELKEVPWNPTSRECRRVCVGASFGMPRIKIEAQRTGSHPRGPNRVAAPADERGR